MSRMKNEKGSGIRPGTFKRLMAYLFSHYRVHLITVIICIIVTAVASVGQTVYIQILIDQCILPGVESGMDMDIENGLRMEATTFGMSFATHDKAEGMRAFLEKRPAQFTD